MVEQKDKWEGLYAGDVNQLKKIILPVGSIVAWLKNFEGTPQLPDNWVECNGQTIDDPESPLNGVQLPNLNGENRFLRGNSTSGGTGGSETHRHQCHSDNINYAPGGTCDYDTYTGHCDGYSYAASHLPPYYNVVWIMRIK